MSWPRGGLLAAGQRELRGAGSDRLVVEAALEACQQRGVARVASKFPHDRRANAVAKICLARVQAAIQPLHCLIPIPKRGVSESDDRFGDFASDGPPLQNRHDLSRFGRLSEKYIRANEKGFANSRR